MVDKDWWFIERVPRPVYVNIKPRKRGVRFFIAIMITFVLMMIAQVVNVLSPELAILITGFIVFSQLSIGFIKGYFRGLSPSDITLIQNILRELDGKIITWSVPSYHIPVAARLVNGNYLYLFISKGKLHAIIAKPVVHAKIYKPMKKQRLIKLEHIGRYRDKIHVYRIDIILPFPDNPRIWYRMIIRGTVINVTTMTPYDVVKLSLENIEPLPGTTGSK